MQFLSRQNGYGCGIGSPQFQIRGETNCLRVSGARGSVCTRKCTIYVDDKNKLLQLFDDLPSMFIVMSASLVYQVFETDKVIVFYIVNNHNFKIMTLGCCLSLIHVFMFSLFL